jgi:putative heme iron utilization protein
MKNRAMQSRLKTEVLQFIHSHKSLQLASLDADGSPHASYAPFGIGDDCLYVLLSELASHGLNLQRDPRASVLIIEDEAAAANLFARVRINYTVRAERLDRDSLDWQTGIDALVKRLGEFPGQLTQLQDFKLFRLVPSRGRYTKGFGRAYDLQGNTLAGDDELQHSDGS